MLKISIPTPCNEDWNKMTPDETGRHCSACAKSVVDFTGMSDEEVKYFFLNKKDERVCGRFKQTQLHRIVIELPQNIFSIQMPLWKKFLAACLIIFSTTLFSCETKIKDKEVTHVQTQDLKPNPISDHVMVGGIGFSITPDSIKTVEVCSETVGISAIEIINDTTINELTDSSRGFTGGIVEVKTDSVPFLHIRPTTDIQKLKCSNDTTELMGDLNIIPVNESKPEKTLLNNNPAIDHFFVGAATLSSIYKKRNEAKKNTDSIKTKNPPKADSINCNTIKNYY